MKERTTWQHRPISKTSCRHPTFTGICIVCVLFSERHEKPLVEGKNQENWHAVVDKASVEIYGSRLVEENKLKQKLGLKQADSIMTLLKLANEKHIAL